MRKLPVTLILLVILAACTPSPLGRTLRQADALIEDNPDSALALVSAIPSSSLVSPGDRALHALLLTQALTKTYNVITSDSLITLAVNHYRDRDPRRFMKSLFYRGDIRHSDARYPDAMRDAMRAHDLAVELNDPYWRAKTAELMGFIFSKVHLRSDGAAYSLEAATYYNKVGKVANHRYALCDYAIDLGNAGEEIVCCKILDSISTVTKLDKSDPYLVKYCAANLFTIGYFLNDSNRYNLIERNFDDIVSFLPETAHINNYKAMYSLDKGDLDSALLYITRADKLNNSLQEQALVYKLYSDYYERTNNYRLAKTYLDSALQVQNEETKRLLEQTVIGAQRDAIAARLTTQQKHENDFKRNIIFLIVILVLALTLVFVYVKTNYHIKRIKQDSLVSDFLSVSEQFIPYGDETLFDDTQTESTVVETISCDVENTEIHETGSDAHVLVENLFREKWEMLNMLCNQYFEIGNDSKYRVSILNRIYSEINKMTSESEIRKIEDSVNRYMNNVVNCLREECPFLKKDDITFLTLIIAGFSAKTVCMFTNISLKNFYTKKSRLLKRIKESGSSKVELILSKFP